MHGHAAYDRDALVKRVLILNTGSSSVKWSILDATTGSILDGGSRAWQTPAPGRHAAELQAMLAPMADIDAVGHRVVHGGARFTDAVLIDEAVRAAILDLAELAPLHNPAAVSGIDAALAALHGVPQIAAFDTAFHATLPEAAFTYPLPWQWTQTYGARRFGFHGLSVSYAVQRTAALLGQLPHRLLVCHLGAGCSLTAVRDGRSIDTSMGFTPLEGVMMATRAGSIDPGLLIHLLERKGLNAADLDQALNEQSGLLGVSGISADLREVLAAMAHGSSRATLAYAVFVHRLTRVAGGLIAVLGGLDALVFTAGIGEHSAKVRHDVAAACAFLGLSLDGANNEAGRGDRDIAAPSSTIRALVIEAREDLAILAAVRRLLGWDTIQQTPAGP
jgi:acetate kinase